MASRIGPSVQGSDGNDYNHRETIVSQYIISSSQNSDPGVHESEDEAPSFSSYPDTNEFIKTYMKSSEPSSNKMYPLSPNSLSSETNNMILIPASQVYMVNGDQMKKILETQNQSFEKDMEKTKGLSNVKIPTKVELDSSSSFVTNEKEKESKNMTPLLKISETYLSSSTALVEDLFVIPSTNQYEATSRSKENVEIAQTKTRLKWNILFHYVLSFLMILKVLPDILDRLDIFFLTIEELYIPQPLLWEWLWLLSFPISFLGLFSVKKSGVGTMRNFFLGTCLFGLIPDIIGFTIHFPDVLQYIQTKSTKGLSTWNGYPVGVLWYIFLFLSLQTHLFELYFSKILIGAWQRKTIKKS